jgi:hypothetical protein
MVHGKSRLIGVLVLGSALALGGCSAQPDSAQQNSAQISSPVASATSEPAGGYRQINVENMASLATKTAVQSVLPSDSTIGLAIGESAVEPVSITLTSGVGDSSVTFTVTPGFCAPVQDKGIPADVTKSVYLRWDSVKKITLGGSSSKIKYPKSMFYSSISQYPSASKAAEAFTSIAEETKACQEYKLGASIDGGSDSDIEIKNPFAQVSETQDFIQWADVAPTLETASAQLDALVLVGNSIVSMSLAKPGVISIDNVAAFNLATSTLVKNIAGASNTSSLTLFTLDQLAPNATFANEGQSLSTTGLVYSVSGNTPSASMTYETASGTAQTTSSLPWTKTITGISPGEFVYVSAQAESGNLGTTVSCTITFNGKELASVTSSGGYSIAQCDGKLPSLSFP